MGEAAVDVDAFEYFVAIELRYNFTSTSLKLLAVFLGPPIAEVASSIIFTALIVKAMRKLMANHGTNAAIIHRVFGIRIVKRRL